jgi:hypothetical protein
MDDLAWKQAEMSRELKSARTWLLVVTLLQLAVGVVQLYVMKLPNGLADAPPELAWLKTKLTIATFVPAAIMGGLWLYSKQKPKLCLILALITFWTVHLWWMAQDSGNAYRGILIKILFTLALIKGIRSASRSEELSKELGKVFE